MEWVIFFLSFNLQFEIFIISSRIFRDGIPFIGLLTDSKNENLKNRS